MSLPKILHQLAPANKDDWHPIWHKCRESWINNFKSVNFILWSDEEAESLVNSYYPDLYDLYKKFPFQINRIDFVRFCILHKYGGVYADMDMYCYKDFFNELTKDCYIVGSGMQQEIVQNSLMASQPNSEFFFKCIYACKNAFDSGIHAYDKSNITSKQSNDYVLNVTGPRLLTNVYNSNKSLVNILSVSEYNPNYLDYNDSIKTKHMLTGRWGTEMMNIKKAEHEPIKNSVSHQDFLKADYKGFRNIDVDNFDFNKTYTR